MSWLTRILIRSIGRAAARRFDGAARDPVAAQQRTLTDIVDRNRDTEYGREHRFASIRTIEDYRQAVPIVTYEDIRERVERMTLGQPNILTAEAPVMFARTSGTTGKPKFIPVTPTCQGRDHSDQMRTWLYHALCDHPSLFDGKVVSMVSPAVEGHTPGGIPYGSTSGVMYRDMPWLVRGTYAIPYPLFEIEDYEVRYYCILRLALARDITFLATANPSSVIKMCETVQDRAGDLMADIADGSIRYKEQLPIAAREAMASHCRADPARTRALEEARKRRGGKMLPADYWPNLALIGCWKGGTVGHYLEQFNPYFNPDRGRAVPVRDWGYLSSEARCSVPLSDEGCGGVLTVAGNICEFVPVEEVDEHEDWHQWRPLGPHQLQQGQSYYVIVTTTGGLYRYDINDIITVEGWHHHTPVIAFARKGRGVTSITGEKVSVDQVIEAFEHSGKELGMSLEHFKAEARVDDARYVFKVELDQEVPEGRLRELLQLLEKNLASLNLEYASKRQSQRLKPPVLEAMKAGWYEHSKNAHLHDNKRLFQAKTILLTDAQDSEDKAFVTRTVTMDGGADRAKSKEAAA